MGTKPKVSVLPDPSDRPTVSVTEAARFLGIGRNAAYQAVARGELPAISLGRRIVIPTAALRRMLGLDEGRAAERRKLIDRASHMTWDELHQLDRELRMKEADAQARYDELTAALRLLDLAPESRTPGEALATVDRSET